MKQRESDGHVIGESPETTYYSKLVVSWILSHPNARFSVESLAQEVGCSWYVINQTIAKPGIRELLTYSEEAIQKRYQCVASEIESTFEGVLEIIEQRTKVTDELGRQAREEFYEREHNDFRFRSKRIRAKKF